MVKPIPIKIVDQTGDKYAIVASSFQNLIEQAQEIFKITESVKIFSHDGARINEDYFNLVEPDTTFTVLKEDEVWDDQQNSKLNEDYINEIQKLKKQLQAANQIESSICLGELLGALKEKILLIKSDGRLEEMMRSCNMNEMLLGTLEREIDVFTAVHNANAHMGN